MSDVWLIALMLIVLVADTILIMLGAGLEEAAAELVDDVKRWFRHRT